MKRRLLFWAGVGVALLMIAMTPTSILQGKDYEVQTITMPLGWKTIHFLSRHHQMALLIRQIVPRRASEEEKAMAIYRWVRSNIHRGVPKGLPVMDDHVSNIVIRGYGTEDQIADLFTALCTYAGLEARWRGVLFEGERPLAVLSLVQISGDWILMDPYRDVISRSPMGELEDVRAFQEEIRSGKVRLGSPSIRGIPYTEAVLSVRVEEFSRDGMNRGISQMPLKRLIRMILRET